MEINNIVNLLTDTSTKTDNTTQNTADSEQGANSLQELIDSLRNDPQYKELFANLDSQAIGKQTYSTQPGNGLAQVNLQSNMLTDWLGVQNVYTKSQQFYSLMDTLFYSEENQDGGYGVDQVDFSTLQQDSSYGVTTGLAAALQKK